MFMGDYKVMVLFIVREVGILELLFVFKRFILKCGVKGDVYVVFMLLFVMMVMEFDLLLEKEVDVLDEFLLVIVRCILLMKVRMIDVLYRRKKYVVMMGDGVNDVFSLKKVDVGIVMGVGSDVVKISSEIVFIDNNFVIIV